MRRSTRPEPMLEDIMTIEVQPLTENIGNEIRNVDLSQPLSDADFAAIREAWLQGTILLFRHQTEMTPEQHIAFSRRFGELEIHHLKNYTLPDHPEIFVLSNIKAADGRQVGAPRGGRQWHTDSHFLKKPSAASLLHAKEVPDEGGATMFANMYAAYDALTPKRREELADLKVLISRVKEYATGYEDRPPMTEEEKAALPDVIHPLVRTHPETGRKALFVNVAHTTRFSGMTAEESAPILNYLFRHQIREEFRCRFRWRPGSLAFWDNRCAQHYPINDYHGHRRLLHRITLAGDRPR